MKRQEILSTKSLHALGFREKIHEILGYLPSHQGVQAATSAARTAAMSDTCTIGYRMGLIASSIAVRNIFVYTNNIVHEYLPGDHQLVRELKATIVSMYNTVGEVKLRDAIVNDYQNPSKNADIFRMAVPRYIELGLAYNGLYVQSCKQHMSVFGALDPLITLEILTEPLITVDNMPTEWALQVLRRLFNYVVPPRVAPVDLIGVSSLWLKGGDTRAFKDRVYTDEGSQTLLKILSGQLSTPIKTWNHADSPMHVPDTTSHKRKRREYSSTDNLASLPPLFLRAYTQTSGSNDLAGGQALEMILRDQGCSDTDSVLWRPSPPSVFLGTDIPDIRIQSVRMRQAVLKIFHTSQGTSLASPSGVNTMIDVVATQKTAIYNKYIKTTPSDLLHRTRFVCDCVMGRVLTELGAPPHFWSMNPIHCHRRLQRQAPGSVTCSYGKFDVETKLGHPIVVHDLKDEPQPAMRIYEALASRAEGYHLPSKRPLLLNKITVRVWAKAKDLQPPIVHEYRYHSQSVFKNQNLDTQIDPPLSCIDIVGVLAGRSDLAKKIFIDAQNDPFHNDYSKEEDPELHFVCQAVSEIEERMK